MTYPLSSTVSAGQPTAADHYNHLRQDALYLGNDPADSALLGDFLSTYSANLNLERLETDRLRIAATSSTPVAIMVAGRLLRTSSNVDLSTALAPSGSAALWYVFVQAESGDNSPHLIVNTSSSPTASQRLIASFYWDGSQIAPDSVVLITRSALLAAYQFADPITAGGRLSLASQTPIEHNDCSGLTIYYTPFLSNTLSLYAPGADLWIPHVFEEIAITLPGTTNQNYDLFASFDGNGMALSAQNWVSDTARAAALSLQDGQLVLESAPGQRYLGTCRVNASGVVADTETERFLWNAINQRSKLLTRYENTSHTYQSINWRVWNNVSTSKLAFICGQPQVFTGELHSGVKGSTAGKIAATGIGMNTATYGTKDLACYLNQHFHAGISYSCLAQTGLNEVYIVERAEDSYSATFSYATLMSAWNG